MTAAAGRRGLPRLAADFLIVIVGGLLLYASVGATWGQTIGRRDPDSAGFWPSAPAQVAAAEARLNRRSADRSAIAADALDVWRREPLAVGALRLIAATGAPDRADGLYRHVESLTRRDQFAQMWLFNGGMASDDVAQAMLHADRALRTSTRARPDLFQTLTYAAARNGRMRAGVIGLIAARPNYWREFYQSILLSADAASILPDLVRPAALRLDDPAERSLAQSTVSRLLALRRPDDALAAHLLYFPQRRGETLANGGFEADPVLIPFDWQIGPDAGLETGGGGRGGRADRALTYHATSDGDVGLALQALVLPPGGYDLSFRYQVDSGAPPRVLLTCLRSGAAVTPAPASRSDGERVHASFSAAEGCGYYLLTLMQSGGGSGWIDDVTVAPTGDAARTAR